MGRHSKLSISKNSPWRLQEAIDEAVRLAENPLACDISVKQKKKQRHLSETNDIHIPLMEWVYKNEESHPSLIYVMHAPNEGKRGWKAQSNLRLLGVRKGIPDIIWPYPWLNYYGIALELKASKKKPTPEQARWLLHLRKSRWYTDCLDSHHAAIAVFESALHGGYPPVPFFSDHDLESIAQKEKRF